MKHIRKLIVFLLFLPGFLKAQNADNEDLQIFSPNSYSLGKYGDVPTDLSRGLPQISIPLMSLTDKDIHVDISLSYYASGIKVDEEASWVGLGWTLNAGGAITRQVKGIPDENRGTADRTSIPDYDNSGYEAYGARVEDILYNAYVGYTDNEPDIFYYNFCGKTGKFFLDNDAKACFTEYEDFTVQFVRGSNPVVYPTVGTYFIITDDAGIKYEFRDVESTTELLSPGRTYISAWYLSKITSPTGGEITFSYVSGGTTSVYCYTTFLSNIYIGIDANQSVHVIPSEYSAPNFTYYTGISGIVPEKITNSAGNYIEFKYSTNARKDAFRSNSGNNQLDTIILKDSNNVQGKKFKFGYSYFEANDNRKAPFSAYNNLNYRLRLDEVREVSKDNTLLSPYKFAYYGDNDPTAYDPYTLPYRLSPSQDHWGYNNNSNNTSLYPNKTDNTFFREDEWVREFGKETGDPIRGFQVIGGGTREPDNEAVKAGTLNKITYPTGGYTEFDFEAQLGVSNYSPNAGGLRIKQIKTDDGNGHTRIKNYTYNPYYFDSNSCFDNENSKYYILYHQKNNNASSYEDCDPAIPNVMMAFGVPANIANNYCNILRVDGSRQAYLGSGREAIYTHVTETVPGNGRTEYFYSFSENNFGPSTEQVDGIPTPGMFYSAYVVTRTMSSQYFARVYSKSLYACTQPFPDFVNNSWRCGKLISKEVYSESGQLLMQDSLEYDMRALNAIPGYKVLRLTDPSEYLYARYYLTDGLVKLTKEVNKVYDDNGNVIRRVKEYDYTSPYHKHVTETKEHLSSGADLTTRYYYTPDYGTYFSALKNKNIIAPIDVRTYNGNKLVAGKQRQYNNNGQPEIRYRAEPTTADIPFNVQVPFTFSPYLWYAYDPVSNNLQMLTTRDGINTVYLWGYNKTYPVAKIENATSGQVKTVLGGAIPDFGAGSLTTSQVAALRSIPNAYVTTYTYIPLIGMTSSTDPNGVTTYYEYDGFGRLKLTRDDDNAIDQRYRYHYGDPLSVSPESLSYDSKGGTQVVPVTSSLSWTVSTSQTWITASPASGSGNGTVSITCSSNTGSSSRSGTVTIRGGEYTQTVTITQEGALLNVSPGNLTFASNGGTKSVSVTSNLSWSVTDNQSWITVSPASGSGNGTVSITCSSNIGSFSRSGTLTISGGGLTKTIEVTQEGDIILEVSGSTLFFPKSELTKTFTITSTTSWEITDDSSWITVTPATGSGNATITVRCLPTSVNRIGQVTVSSGGITRHVTIRQYYLDITPE